METGKNFARITKILKLRSKQCKVPWAPSINLKFPPEFINETFPAVFFTNNILASSFIFEGYLGRKLKVITKERGKAQNKKRRSQKNKFAIGLNWHNVKAVI